MLNLLLSSNQYLQSLLFQHSVYILQEFKVNSSATSIKKKESSRASGAMKNLLFNNLVKQRSKEHTPFIRPLAEMQVGASEYTLSSPQFHSKLSSLRPSPAMDQNLLPNLFSCPNCPSLACDVLLTTSSTQIIWSRWISSNSLYHHILAPVSQPLLHLCLSVVPLELTQVIPAEKK